MSIEALIRGLAVGAGILILAAPFPFLLWQARRSIGRTMGVGAVGRRWPGVMVVTVVFVVAGVWLWRPVPLAIPAGLNWLPFCAGSVLYFPGISLYGWGLVTLRAQFGVSGILGAQLYRGHTLITDGPYAYLRHPMYAGVLLAALGATLLFRTWAMVLFLPMSLVVVVRAEHEEDLLAEAFGQTWGAYAARVPKWIPRFVTGTRTRGA